MNRYLPFGVFALLLSCQSAPPVKKVDPKVQVAEDRSLGVEIEKVLESKIRLIKDRRSTQFLTDMAKALVLRMNNFPYAEVNVFLRSSARDLKWDSVALPGVRLYLSVGLVKKLDFENELAALIALNLIHIKGRHLVKRLASKVGSEVKVGGVIGDYGSSKFDRSVMIEAIDGAVNTLYDTGYDPRGMVTLWQKYENNLRYSPFRKEELELYKEQTRRAIVQYAPLLNPIIKTDSFLRFQRRVRRL